MSEQVKAGDVWKFKNAPYIFVVLMVEEGSVFGKDSNPDVHFPYSIECATLISVATLIERDGKTVEPEKKFGWVEYDVKSYNSCRANINFYGFSIGTEFYKLHEVYSLVGFGGFQLEGFPLWTTIFPMNHNDGSKFKPLKVRFWQEVK